LKRHYAYTWAKHLLKFDPKNENCKQVCAEIETDSVLSYDEINSLLGEMKKNGIKLPEIRKVLENMRKRPEFEKNAIANK